MFCHTSKRRLLWAPGERLLLPFTLRVTTIASQRLIDVSGYRKLDALERDFSGMVNAPNMDYRVPLLWAYNQPAPSQWLQRVVPVLPVPAHAAHCFQSSALTALPFTPTHLFPATVCAHRPLMRFGAYETAPQRVHTATGLRLMLSLGLLSCSSRTAFRSGRSSFGHEWAGEATNRFLSPGF